MKLNSMTEMGTSLSTVCLAPGCDWAAVVRTGPEGAGPKNKCQLVIKSNLTHELSAYKAITHIHILQHADLKWNASICEKGEHEKCGTVEVLSYKRYGCKNWLTGKHLRHC